MNIKKNGRCFPGNRAVGGTCDFSSSKLKGWSKCEKPSETGRNHEAIWGSSPRGVKTGEKGKEKGLKDCNP